MAGNLRIDEWLCWIAPGWIFDNALREMAKHVSGDLQQLLLSSLTNENGGHLDLRGLPISVVSELFDALTKTLVETRTSGPSSFDDPSFYDGYVRQLEALESTFKQRIDLENNK